MSAFDQQVGGTHYKATGIQPVQFIMANAMGFCEGNIVKYVTRWRDKGGLDDLCKARHYLEFIQESADYRHLVKLLRRSAGINKHRISAEEYIEANELPKHEAGVVRHIWVWCINGDEHNLRSAMAWADELLWQAQQ